MNEIDFLPQTNIQEKLKRFQKARRFFRKRFWNQKKLFNLSSKLTVAVGVLILLWGITRTWELVRTLDLEAWILIWKSIGITFLHVLFSLIIGSLWAIPAGIYIGLNPKLSRIFQPIVQIAASFPAPMLYPLALILFYKMGFVGPRHAHWISVVFMVLGVQWYVLFNVLAGTSNITKDLKDSLDLMGITGWEAWKKLYLPCVFPSLVTGWVTSAGGAWNASIVAEYLQYNDLQFVASGIGSLISQVTAKGDFPMLAGCLIVMIVVVVGLNRTVWRWAYELAENKYKAEK